MGRRLTTGRFETREELEEFIWFWWLHSQRRQVDIARAARVSETLTAKIIEKKIREQAD